MDWLFNDWDSLALGEWRAGTDARVKVHATGAGDSDWGTRNAHDVLGAVSWVGVNAELTTGTASELGRGDSQAGNQSGSDEEFHIVSEIGKFGKERMIVCFTKLKTENGDFPTNFQTFLYQNCFHSQTYDDPGRIPEY